VNLFGWDLLERLPIAMNFVNNWNDLNVETHCVLWDLAFNMQLTLNTFVNF